MNEGVVGKYLNTNERQKHNQEQQHGDGQTARQSKGTVKPIKETTNWLKEWWQKNGICDEICKEAVEVAGLRGPRQQGDQDHLWESKRITSK